MRQEVIPSEDAMRMLNAPPERIYLQVGDIDSEFPGEIHWRDVTWCDEQVERSDLLYVSAGKVDELQRDVNQLKGLLSEILENDGAEGSKCFDEGRLFEARQRAQEMISRLGGVQ